MDLVRGRGTTGGQLLDDDNHIVAEQ
jgi:hypothetical protein